METIFSFIRSLTFSDKKFGFPKADSFRYSNHNKLALLLLFPFFAVSTSLNYADSALSGFLSCGKDIFYRLMNDCSIDCRNLNYGLTVQLLRKVGKNSGLASSNPHCLIIDDTDLPKIGRWVELASKIFSHVTHAVNLGFKGLFIG